MKMYELEREQTVACPLDQVFAFFERPENLVEITPPAMRFEILTPLPIRMMSGAVIDYTVKVFGVRTRWTTLITDYDPPHRFSDVQLRGPYHLWHHSHRFESINGGTRLIDNVRYILPFGLLGRLAHSLLVRPQLDTIFDYRHGIIEQRFGRTAE